jgi:hypothetical protein
MNAWLQNYAYRVSMQWWVIAAAVFNTAPLISSLLIP